MSDTIRQTKHVDLGECADLSPYFHFNWIFANMCICRCRNPVMCFRVRLMVCSLQAILSGSESLPTVNFKHTPFHQLHSREVQMRLNNSLADIRMANFEQSSYTCSPLLRGSISESDEESLYSQSAREQDGFVFATSAEDP